jgi:hypothetical protein
MYIAHGPISYLANEIIQNKKIKQLKTSEQILVALCSLFFGILPDFDILILSIFNAPRFIHHDIVTHSPILYIGIWILIKGLILFSDRILNKKTRVFFDKKLLNILANTFLIGTLSHLLADLLVNSIMLLYPLSDYRFYILKFIFEPNLFVSSAFTVIFAFEILFIATFVYFVYKRFFIKNSIVTRVLQGLLFLCLIYLPFTMYISLNTYNSIYLYDKDGEINYDIDYDGISDKFDMDIGNTGKSNIAKGKGRKILESAMNIVDSGKWTSKDDNALISQIKGLYGGFDSYRLVSQTYYDVRLPIEPVLRDYYIKKHGFKSYVYDGYEYSELLFEYLAEEKRFIELEKDEVRKIQEGKIFFVKGKDILNLGITLEDNNLATVLDTDLNLSVHSYTDILEYYGEELEKIYIQR